MYFSWYSRTCTKKSFVSLRYIIVITKFRVTITIYCRPLTLRTNVLYHERNSRFYFSVLWLFCENLYNVDMEMGSVVHNIKVFYEWLILCVVLRVSVNHPPRYIIRELVGRIWVRENERKVTNTKFYVTNNKRLPFSRWILSGD